MTRKLFVFLVIASVITVAGCIQPSEEEKSDINITRGIYSNANRLYEDYKWKLELVIEIQQRTDASGAQAGRDTYVEWKRRNNEAIDAGERLASYITENRHVLDQFWTSDVLVLIAKNKVTFERDNQALERKINELVQNRYKWEIDYYDREGSRDLGTLTFINSGTNLSDVRFRFVFYSSNEALYSEESVHIGDVASNEIVRKKVSLPGRYRGAETWSQEKIFVYVNDTLRELWLYKDDEWRKQQVD